MSRAASMGAEASPGRALDRTVSSGHNFSKQIVFNHPVARKPGIYHPLNLHQRLGMWNPVEHRRREGWALERKRLGGARQPVDSAWELRRLRRPGERGAEGEPTWAG
eukprot:scaffold18648_cov124-Isochrysis_galbana.AAC.3